MPRCCSGLLSGSPPFTTSSRSSTKVDGKIHCEYREFSNFLLSISSHPDALFDRRFVDESRDTLFNLFFPSSGINLSKSRYSRLSRIFYSSRCCTRIHLTPFSFSSRFQDRYLLHLPFTGNIRIIYIEITRSRWEKLLKVNCGRRERERGGKFGKFDLLGIASLPSLPSLSTANSFPLVQNFSAERKHCTEGHTGTRSDGSTTDGAQPSRSSPASARVSARTARRPLFTAGFPSS